MPLVQKIAMILENCQKYEKIEYFIFYYKFNVIIQNLKMCDRYGCNGMPENIDIEDLDKKADSMLNSEFEKPTHENSIKLKPLILEIINTNRKLDDREITAIKRKYKFNGKRSYLFQTYLLLLKMGELDNISSESDELFRESMKIKAVKSWSGVCNITIFTSPFPEYTDVNGERVKQTFSCGKACSFCPSEPGMPKSYLTLEPATLRAKKNGFDCVNQMFDRMNTLYITGHGSLAKIEVCILGGTFSHYPEKYREEFVRDVYYAANTFWNREGDLRERLSLNQEKNINDLESKCKVVQIVIETRPDCLTARELKLLRYLSVTRIQMGIQHIDDYVLEKNNRECSTARTIKAIEDAKRCGFKIDGHFMPNMPFSTVEKDKKMLLDHLVGLKTMIKRTENNEEKRTWKEWFLGKPKKETRNETWEYYDLSDEGIQVDQMKIYPTAVTVYTDIEKWYKSGEYVPYEEKYLVDMLLDFKSLIFPWIRLNRIMRDFYADNIYSISGSNLNMRTELHKILEKEGKMCSCIRCREAKLNKMDDDYIMMIRKYRASNGDEYFISAESNDNKILYGFVRLRLDDAKNKLFSELNDAALLREAHVYSTVTDIGKKGKVQHRGLGTLLMKRAEEIAMDNGYKKMAVIAAVGSRGFYRKLDYEVVEGSGEYMMKTLT